MASEYDRIPAHMMAAMQDYVQTGYVSSDFLQAVIDNDLKAAVNTADDYNIHIIHIYVRWFYNRAPALCWGGPVMRKVWVGLRNMKP